MNAPQSSTASSLLTSTTNMVCINPSSSLLRNSPSFCIYLSITRISSFRASSILINTKRLRKEMLEWKAVVVGETDMRQAMQKYALDLASKALDCFDTTPIHQEGIRQGFTELDGSALWGTDFGSFVMHRYGCFIYFSIGNLAILLFKGSSVPVPDEEDKQFLTLEPVKE